MSLMDDVGRIEELIMGLKESLERELGALESRFDGLEQKMDTGFAQINSRFDTQAARLDRHAAYWQTGRRWSGKMEDWAEKIDQSLEAKDRQLADLLARISKLEHKRE
jgi:hypothetical protein